MRSTADTLSLFEFRMFITIVDNHDSCCCFKQFGEPINDGVQLWLRTSIVVIVSECSTALGLCTVTRPRRTDGTVCTGAVPGPVESGP